MSFRRATTAASLGYLVGTFPTADILSRRAAGGAVDLRTTGSGNPGAANAIEVLGRRAGYTVMAIDIAKGALAAGAGALVAGRAGAHTAATAAVIGHCLPVWNGGKGGKGVAPSVGQCLATFPAYFPIDLGVAAITAANPRWKQRAFTATLVSSVCWVLAGVIWWRRQWPNLWGPRPTAALPAASLASSAIIAYKFASARTPVQAAA